MRFDTLVLIASVGLGCHAKHTSSVSEGAPLFREVVLETSVNGLSGLTEDADGYLWAIGEQGDALVRIDPTHFTVEEFAVTGAGSALEFESLAWVEETRFAIGTETDELSRKVDALLYGTLHGNDLAVDEAFVCEYREWSVSAPDSHGVEGLCHVAGRFLVAVELSWEDAATRWAPLGVYDPDLQAWTPHRLRLTTPTGRLSGITCKIVDGDVIALTIERHFEVCKVLRVRVPMDGEGQRLQPEAELDLAKLIEDPPNFEGIVWREDDSLVLLVDNRYKGQANSPTRLFIVPPDVVRSALLSH